MGNTLCAGAKPAVGPAPSKQASLSRRSSGSAASAKVSLGRISSGLRRASSRVLGWRSHAAAANARHQLEDRLAEAIQVAVGPTAG